MIRLFGALGVSLGLLVAAPSPTSAAPDAQIAARPGKAAKLRAKPARKPGKPNAKTAPARARTAIAATPRGRPLPSLPKHDGAHARVAINRAGDLVPGRELAGPRQPPLSLEESTAKQLEQVLRGPLRRGTTGLYVVDARTGDPLFAVNAEDALNPASNVKMISTAAALELLGPDFTYATRVLGPQPVAGVVRGDVYLLGSYDPTLDASHLDALAASVAARGITRIAGSVVVGSDPARDGLYRASVPITVRAGEPGGLAVASVPAGMDLVALRVTAKTARNAARARLTYQVESGDDGAGHPRVTVTIGGTIGKGGATSYVLPVRERTALAAYALRAALRAHGVALVGEVKTVELERYVNDTTPVAGLPIELARHDSARLSAIVAQVNKWSINWLADRVIMTAAALTRRQPPTMELALAAMYDWLTRHPHIDKNDLVVDTGSGLSYRTRITARELVSIVRSAAGFTAGGDATQSKAWLDSLSVAGTDGTLRGRFRSADLRGKLRAKTGTLSTVIALSGVLDVDPQRPLAFALVTNSATPLPARYTRIAHEQLVGVLSRYAQATRKPGAPVVAAPAPIVPAASPTPPMSLLGESEALEQGLPGEPGVSELESTEGSEASSPAEDDESLAR